MGGNKNYFEKVQGLLKGISRGTILVRGPKQVYTELLSVCHAAFPSGRWTGYRFEILATLHHLG
jgi:hypothetical protein